MKQKENSITLLMSLRKNLLKVGDTKKKLLTGDLDATHWKLSAGQIL